MTTIISILHAHKFNSPDSVLCVVNLQITKQSCNSEGHMI